MVNNVFLLAIIGISFMGICIIILSISIIIEQRKRNKILFQETNGISNLLFFIITRTICKSSKRISDKRTHNSSN